MIGGSAKSMVAMLITMQYSSQLDETDPETIMFARTFFVTYLAVAFCIYALLSNRIGKKKDPRVVVVTAPPNPFAAAAAAASAGEGDANAGGSPSADATSADPDLPAGSRRQTVMEYDREMVDNAQRGLMMNAVLVGGIHYKMGTLSPIIMTSVMGMVRLLDDPQVKLHLLGMADVGPLERPFKNENPLLKMLGMGGPEAGSAAADGSPAGAAAETGGSAGAAAVEEEEEEVEVIEEVEYVDEDDLDEETKKRLAAQDAESKKDK